ncbi:MAG: DivIVA domain-containing protein [Clostridiales bacterium]|nr:DivIVA domain-containing protein [Candidatus Crickella equi]
MIMPIDIDKKEFSRDKRGYNSREVDEFLDLIVVDYEKVLNDNRSMAHKIKALEKQLEEAQKSDTEMVETLQTAKKLMSDISASAERRAELMMRDAELEAENILMDAKVSVKKLQDEHSILTTKVTRLRKNLKRMLETELAELDNDEYDLLPDMDLSNAKLDEPKVEAAPAKTIIVAEEDKVEVERKAAAEDSSLLDELFQEGENTDAGFSVPPVTDLEHATISDLSDSLKKMAEQPASLNDTIILK